MKIKLATSLALMALLGATSAKAINVALELALLVDVSSSISPIEYGTQKDGYAAAFRDPDIISAITSNPNGIAVTYIEWAGRRQDGMDVPPLQRIGWTHLFDAASSMGFADMLDALGGKPDGLGPFTNIVGAINFAAMSFSGNGFDGNRQVIDISGDGPDNYNGIPVAQIPIDASDVASFYNISGPAVAAASAAAIGMGVDTINGLPVVLPTVDLVGLDNWYQQFVIADNGDPAYPAFIAVADSYEDIGPTIKLKILKEIPRVPDTGSTVALLGLGLLALASIRRWNRN